MSIEFTYPTITGVHGKQRNSAAFVDANDPAAVQQAEKASWGEDGFGVGDFIDMINPLQHIPVVSNIYRAVTGDEIAQGARVLGGGIFGGIVGLASSTANVIAEQETGADVTDTALGFLSPTQERAAQNHLGIQVAQAAPASLMGDIASLPTPPDLSPLQEVTLSDAEAAVSTQEVHDAVARYQQALWQTRSETNLSVTG